MIKMINNKKKENFLIIDGNNLFYSSYYVSQKLSYSFNTVFFALRVIISIVKKKKYDNILVVFDSGGENFRKKILPEYKSQRVKMTEKMKKEFEEFKIFLIKVNINFIQLIDNEADDVIASITFQNDNPNIVFDIFSRDKDFFQLLKQGKINILKYKEKKIINYTEDDFIIEYNFSSSFFVDYLSLIGDKVDNIKGAKGIGEVSAKKIIKTFNNIENIFYSNKLICLQNNIRKILENNKELILRNKKIINLKKDIKIELKKNEFC